MAANAAGAKGAKKVYDPLVNSLIFSRSISLLFILVSDWILYISPLGLIGPS